MLMEQIFYHDHGHEQALLVSFLHDFVAERRKDHSQNKFSAERLWSPMEITGPKAALPRINEWRCHMIKRGLPAEPN